MKAKSSPLVLLEQNPKLFFETLVAWLVVFEWDIWDKSDYGVLKWRPEISTCKDWHEVTATLFSDFLA
jgi:hypothetical protein